LILAPMLELSMRQSLAMSAGDYMIFLKRPLTVTMLALGVVLLFFSLKPVLSKKKGPDWRAEVGLEDEAA
jgi:TctA family transporter